MFLSPGSRAGTRKQFRLMNVLVADNSASLIDLKSFIPEFNTYEIIFYNLLPATNAVSMEVQVHSGGAFQATSYITLHTGTAAGTPTTYIPLSNVTSQINSGTGTSGRLIVSSPTSIGTHMFIGQSTYQTAGPANANIQVSGYWNSAAAIDGFQILASSGNLVSGFVRVYGYI